MQGAERNRRGGKKRQKRSWSIERVRAVERYKTKADRRQKEDSRKSQRKGNATLSAIAQQLHRSECFCNDGSTITAVCLSFTTSRIRTIFNIHNYTAPHHVQ
jgi:hypothetical protein